MLQNNKKLENSSFFVCYILNIFLNFIYKNLLFITIKNTTRDSIQPDIKSINTCCLINIVDAIIVSEIIIIIIFIYLFEFFVVSEYKINDKLNEQWVDGKQFLTGVSIKYINLVSKCSIPLPTISGLVIVVGNIIKIVLAIIIDSANEVEYLIKLFLSHL